MTSIFRQLPLECTPEISNSERDTLLERGVYIIPGGDSLETVKYSIDTSEGTDYLEYEYSWTTGQRGFIVFELRRFEQSTGKYFIIFSRYGGMQRAYDQQDLKVFNIENNMLIENPKQNLLPENIGIKGFFKEANT